MLKYNSKILFILLWTGIFFLSASPSFCQETKVVQDLNLWTGVAIEKTFEKDWTVSFKQEFRFQKDISEINNYFSQVGFGYRINKNFSLVGKYRFTRNKKKDLSYENKSRYSFDLRFKGKINFITIDYRLRYQKEVESMNLLDKNEPYEKYLRNRIQFKYNDLRKIEPYISGEIFQLFKFNEYPEYDQFRILAGVNYNTGQLGELKLAYGIERELNSSLPLLKFIIRVNYTFKF